MPAAQLVTAEFEVPQWIDLLAVGVGAVQGAAFAQGHSAERNTDIVGVATVGIVTATGGGLLRDLLLNVPPVALQGNSYIATALAATFLGLAFASLVNRFLPVVVALDAASLGLFMVVGTLKAANGGLAVTPSIFVGVVAACGGGLLRDLLTQSDIQMVRVGSLYAAAAALGAACFLALDHALGLGTPAAGSIALAVTFSVRMLSLRFGWETPRADDFPKLWPPSDINLPNFPALPYRRPRPADPNGPADTTDG